LPEGDIARAYLHRQGREARETLFPFSPSGLAGLQTELEALPSTADALIDALFEAIAPGLARLTYAASRRPDDEIAGFVRVMVDRVDSPLARVGLARAVVAMREQATIDDYLAAAALVDLDSPHSVLLCATTLLTVRAELASHALATAGRAPARQRDSDFVAHA
jgi:hypothetical protein